MIYGQAALALLIGVVFTLLGGGTVLTARRRRGRGTVTRGRVIGSGWQDHGTRGDPSLHSVPEVEFVDGRGRRRTFVHPWGTNRPPKAGAEVQVWYDEDDDTVDPVIPGEPVATALPMLFLVIGLGAFALGLWLLWTAVT